MRGPIGGVEVNFDVARHLTSIDHDPRVLEIGSAEQIPAPRRDDLHAAAVDEAGLCNGEILLEPNPLHHALRDGERAIEPLHFRDAMNDFGHGATHVWPDAQKVAGWTLRKFRQRCQVDSLLRKGGRVVYCGGLENRCGRKLTGGSNPSLSAIFLL